MVRAKIYSYLAILVLVLMSFAGWVSDGLEPSIMAIFLVIMAILLLLASYESYYRHPIIKTRAKIVKKHSLSFLSTFPSITFQLPNGKMIRVVIWSTGTHNHYKVGDDVMLTYKGDRARELYHLDGKCRICQSWNKK